MKQGLIISIFIICTIVILYEGYLLYNHGNSDKIVKASAVTGNLPDSSTIAILQVKQGMNRGELLDVDKLDMVEVPVELAPKGSISSLSKVSNMRLKQQIAEKEFLTDLDLMPESAVIEEGDRLIEHNFEDGAIPASVDKGSEIDIKLFIKGGADPVVVSKAVVISRNVNLLSFYMNGMEQELIKEAAAEGMLFAVQYLDGSQSASVVTYATAYGKEEYSNER
jgi:hypothetical protein